MSSQQQNYERLHAISRDTRLLRSISNLLDWDQETYMPPMASGIRGEQLKLLAGIIHKGQVSSTFTNALSKLINIQTGKVKADSLSSAQKAALKEWRKDYLQAKALPKRFVEDFAKLTSQSMHIWHHAKKQNAFNQFAPFLEKIIEMSRQKADLLGYKKHPYNALLDNYEPGMTIAEYDPLFSQLRVSIVKLLKKIMATQKVDDSFLFGKFPEEQQWRFNQVLLKGLHYDLNKGRIDQSGHPFSSAAHPTDSRITTHIHTDSLMSNIFAVLHETGHALYEMGLPAEQYGSPLGEPVSLGIHESQSRWWETRIGHSKAFWKYYLPILQEHFKDQLKGVSLDKFYQAINKVTPSFIRIEADEVTYSLHVILRYELEKALIEGSLKVRDIPIAWNEKMRELLGIVPSSNSEGCLQDIHWSMGAFGYFPTYTLGNLYGAHMFEAFEKEHKDWEKRVAQGDLLFIKEWLNTNVHQHGKRYSSLELLKRITGKPFTADAYIKYLGGKFK